MKLAGLVLATVLGLSSSAHADEVLRPPGGPVFDDPGIAERAPAQQAGQRAHDPRRQAERRARRAALGQALVQQFDANGDGRLGPRERMRAVRVLRRLEQRLAGGARKQQARRVIKRYDVNGDGNVGPREMPPGQADRMRRFDRDGDGWVEPRELRR